MPEKKLKPTLRENKRYLLLEGDFNKKDIEAAILDYLGVLGYAKIGLYFVKNKVIDVNREEVERVRAALALSPKLIKIKRISGSLKKLNSNK